MTRRCSHCSNNGHNSRTCPTRCVGGGGGVSASLSCGGVKLFGVRLTDGSIIKKSASMGNLSASHYHGSSCAAASPNPGSPLSDHAHVKDGYLSDDPTHASCSTNRRGERKKGSPWTEEEHRMFLIGLQKLGKGDWRGISRNFVVSRTPTQVASHAQKYFIRQTSATRRKRRSSLFDMAANDVVTDTVPVPEEQVLLPSPLARETDNSSFRPSLNLSLITEIEPMETKETVKEPEETVIGSGGVASMAPSYLPAYMPVPYLYWLPNAASLEEDKEADKLHPHEILKPIPILPKEPVNVDELVGMCQLSIGEMGRGLREPSPLSLKLLGEPSRQSAFHVNTPVRI